MPYEYILRLEDFFRFAPRCLMYKDFAAKIDPPYDIIASIRMSVFYENLLSKMKTYTSVKEIASLCLDICKPYKYPSNEPLVCRDYEAIFSQTDIDSASLNYLLLEFIYKNSMQKKLTITKSLDTLSVSLSEKDLQRISKKFSSQKHDLLSSSSTHLFLYPSCKDYIYNLICYSNISDTQKKGTTICSIYDFIITAGLLTTPQKDNPFVQFISVKEKSPDNSRLTPNKLENFLNHFYLNELQTSRQSPTFISVASYIVERITNINLINRLYEFSLENGTIFSPFYLLTNYPLVSTRLKLLDLFSQTIVDSSTISRLDISTNSKSNSDSISLINFKDIILHQTFFYFPLLISLFHLLLDIQSKIVSRRLSSPILEKNVCNVLNLETYKPLISFPNDNNMTNEQLPLYHDIQNLVYTLYYEQSSQLIDTDFIYNNFFFCKNPASVVENITGSLNATNYITKDNENLMNEKEPLIMNFNKKKA